jgi:hypothetical protein
MTSPNVARQIEDTYGGGFAHWLKRVDALLLRRLGVTHLDIADRLWRDAFDDGVTPAEIVSEILAEGLDAL